jgi:uncharacterized protein (TIGR02284 family)
MTPNKNVVEHLHRLVRVNKDAEAGFLNAAENVRNSELETQFTSYAKQHGKFAAELQQEAERIGEDAPDSGTVGGAVHRGWMDLKSALTGHSAASILASCEDGEQSAQAAYADAMADISAGKIYTLLEKQRQQITAFRTRLARLVDETKNGLEFKKNK